MVDQADQGSAKATPADATSDPGATKAGRTPVDDWYEMERDPDDGTDFVASAPYWSSVRLWSFE